MVGQHPKDGVPLEALGYVVFLLAVLLACGNGKKEGPTVTPGSAAATQAASTPEAKGADHSKDEAKMAAKIGDTVKFKDSEWTVIKAEDKGTTLKSNNQFQEAAKSDGGKFIVVAFKVKNLGQKEERILDHPKLKDSQGSEFGTIDMQSIYIPDGKKTMGLEALPSSLVKEFWAVYEVAGDSKGLQFMAREVAMAGDTHPVDLGI